MCETCACVIHTNLRTLSALVLSSYINAGIHTGGGGGGGGREGTPPPPPPPPILNQHKYYNNKVVLKHKQHKCCSKKGMHLFKDTYNFSKGVF